LSYALNRFGFILESDLIHRHDFAVCVAKQFLLLDEIGDGLNLAMVGV
jgi:hypothetical protein